MSLDAKTAPLDQAEWVEMAPTFWSPQTGDERLAAVVGYNTGDGTMTTRPSASFYANCRNDVEAIWSDCHAFGVGLNASVTEKKTPDGYAPGYQMQLSGYEAQLLIDAGCPVGKKTMQTFDVPCWIRNGTDGVMRAYLAALFGAEGNAPTIDKSSKSRMPRQPVLNMCKVDPVCGQKFFDSLRDMLEELGVDSSVTVTRANRFEKPYVTYWLRIAPNPDNLVRFFGDVGYLYSADKQLKSWLWWQYLRCYTVERDRRCDTVNRMAAKKRPWSEIGQAISLTRGAAHRLWKSLQEGKQATAGHAFPRFDAWLEDRWIADLGLLKVRAVAREYKSPQTVWNMLVDSPDHSYLLASGVNNFNSFETMSNRVYHAFDRSVHVGRPWR